MPVPNSQSITRASFQSRVELLLAYYDTADEYNNYLWDEAERTLPTKSGYRTAAEDRRELRLTLMMGGPLSR